MIFDYVYYKLYKATLLGSLKDVVHIAVSTYLGSLLFINIFVLNGVISKISTFPFLFSNGKSAGLSCLVLIIIAKLYFNKIRVQRLLEKYSGETRASRIRGNFIMWLYVLISFFLLFVVAYWKPGQFHTL